MLNQHEQLESKLQDLRAWVGNTSLILNSREYDSETDADSLSRRLQLCEVSSSPVLKHVSFVLWVTSSLFSCYRNQYLYLSFLESLIFHSRGNKVRSDSFFRLSDPWGFRDFAYFSFQLFFESPEWPVIVIKWPLCSWVPNTCPFLFCSRSNPVYTHQFQGNFWSVV